MDRFIECSSDKELAGIGLDRNELIFVIRLQNDSQPSLVNLFCPRNDRRCFCGYATPLDSFRDMVYCSGEIVADHS